MEQKIIQDAVVDPAVKIICLDTVDSTNTYTRRIAATGAAEGPVILAESQTNGRGRASHRFVSPAGGGIYMSILLRPSFPAADSVLITPLAAVSVLQAIDAVCHVTCGIKWVNDLYLNFENNSNNASAKNYKKICGILCEGAAGIQNQLDFVIVGIGINVYPPENGFDPSVAEIAGAILPQRTEPWIRERLAAECINRFFHAYRSLPATDFMEDYRKHSLVLNRQITVRGRSARALDIDNRCRLQIMYENGTRANLDSGEVSIKW